MKLINRNKFIKDKDYPCRDENHYYNEKRGEHPERIYECNSNRYRMTVLESIWLYPEYTLIFGKFRKPNIWWFLLTLWCPWFDDIYRVFKNDGMNMSLSDFIILITMCLITISGLGPIFCIILHYNWIKRIHKEISRKSSFHNEFQKSEDFEKYKKIKFF